MDTVEAEISRPINLFAPYLCPEYMRVQLQEHACAAFAEHTIDDCKVLFSRYKTFRKPASWIKSTLSVCYALKLSGCERQFLLYAWVFLNGRSRQQWQQLDKPLAAIHIAELDMIAWPFPHDPGLRCLPQAIDTNQVRQFLPFSQLPTALSGPADISDLTNSVVKYSPEKCCTTRYNLKWYHDSHSYQINMYGKTYRTAKGYEVYQRLLHFWQMGQQQAVDKELRVAQPLGYSTAIQTLWLAEIVGSPLLGSIRSGNYRHYIEQIATGLIVIHGSELTSSTIINKVELLADCGKKIDKITRTLPTTAVILYPLLEQVEYLANTLFKTAGVKRLIYGDFHIEQLLVQNDKVFFLDFDSFALGDPEQDIAEFIVALQFYQLPMGLIQVLAEELLICYRQQAPWQLSGERLYWYAMLEYVIRLYRFYLAQRPDWREQLQQSLNNLAPLQSMLRRFCTVA